MEPISTLLFKIYRGTPQHGDWIVACLQGAWTNLLGERLAQVCRPSAFADFRLEIDVLDRDWEGALRATERGLTERIRTATGDEVRQLRFVFSSSCRPKV